MANKLFVGGLAWGTTDATLRDFFSQFGTVLTANVVTDKFTGKSRGFGFVEMSTDEEAKIAAEQGNGKDLDGRTINVNEARPQEKRDNGGGGGYNRGGGDRSGGGYGGGFNRGGGDRNRGGGSGGRGGDRGGRRY